MGKQSLSIYIVEDMAVTRLALEQVLIRRGHNVVGSAATANAAITQMSTMAIDIVLLDVNLRGVKDGIWIGHYIRENFDLPIVYLTAYGDDDTLKRIHSTSPNGYIMKPFDKPTLLSTIEIAYSNFVKKEFHEPAQTNNHFMVTKKSNRVKVPFNEIFYFQSSGNYLTVETLSGTYIERMALKEVLDLVPQSKFAKINRNTIVNIDHVSAIQKEELKMDDRALPISRVYKKELIALFEANNTSIK